MRTWRAAALAATSFLAAAAPALACPSCAGRDGAGIGGIIALGSMILLPFAIVAVAWPAIKRSPARS